MLEGENDTLMDEMAHKIPTLKSVNQINIIIAIYKYFNNYIKNYCVVDGGNATAVI